MQLIIDSSKRTYEVDAIAEISRIKHLPCMRREKDFPEFMRYTRSIITVSDGKELPYEDVVSQRNKIISRIDWTLTCPMNHLQEWLSKIQGISSANSIPTREFFVKLPGKPRYEQMSKILRLVEEFEWFVRSHMEQLEDPDFTEIYFDEYEGFLSRVKNVRIGNPVTINRMISSALSLTTTYGLSNHARKILNCLYRTNPEKFLMSFQGIKA